jgi:hypothetical protein
MKEALSRGGGRLSVSWTPSPGWGLFLATSGDFYLAIDIVDASLDFWLPTCI